MFTAEVHRLLQLLLIQMGCRSNKDELQLIV